MDRPIPTPTGTPTDIRRVRREMVHRHREEQSQINQPYLDTIPGEGSGDE